MIRKAKSILIKLVLAAVEPCNSIILTNGPTSPHNMPADRICRIAKVSLPRGS